MLQQSGEAGRASEPSAVPLGMKVQKTGISKLWLLVYLVLAIYSLSLLFIEATSSQEDVRLYFTDIGMPFKEGYFAAPTGDIGYGVNTSLSSFFFGCAGVLMLFAAVGAQKPTSRQTTLFMLQGGIFLYLSLDDRFMLHERIGSVIGIYSIFILAFAGLLNVIIYLWLFRFSYFNTRMVWIFGIAAGLTGTMVVFDVLLPHDMPMRLSGEDLLKTWSGLFFLQFAWEAARFSLVGQPGGEPGFELPEPLLRLVPVWFRARLTS